MTKQTIYIKIEVDAKDQVDALELVEYNLSFNGDFWNRIKDVDYSATGKFDK